MLSPLAEQRGLTDKEGVNDNPYYEMTPPQSLGERLTIAARRCIHADFMRVAQPTADTTILDVGVSDVAQDMANIFERLWPHQNRITGAGLDAGDHFRQAFPAVAYQQVAAGAPLPFGARQFDLAISNAVLEHVGSAAAQLAFLGELLRVAGAIFVTVPHRYFPIEHHTGIPLLHYADAPFRAACRLLGKSYWASRDNLILMSKASLATLVDELRRTGAIGPADSLQIGHTGFHLGPFSSNLYLYIKKA